MQEKKKDSYPLGICQRLFNFIINGLTASCFKRVTLGTPAVAGSMVEKQSISPSNLNGEVMPVHYLDHENSKDDLVSQIGISFTESVGDRLVSSNYRPRMDDEILQSGKQVKLQEPKDKTTGRGKKIGSETPSRKEQLQGKSLQDIDQPNQIPVVRPRGLQKTVTVKNTAGEEKTKSKGKSVEATEIEDQGEKVTKKEMKIPGATEDEGIMEAKTPSPITRRPFLGPSIDDISDEYIRKRKEEMTRILELEKKS